MPMKHSGIQTGKIKLKLRGYDAQHNDTQHINEGVMTLDAHAGYGDAECLAIPK